MPNWCYTNVRISASHKSIQRLSEEFEKAFALDEETDFGEMWLGKLLLHIGMPLQDVVYGDIRCRGEIEDIDYGDVDSLPTDTCDEEEIQLHMSSAWGPHLYCIQMFVNHFVEDAVITYDAIEDMCELYWTNDPQMVGAIYVDTYISDDLPEELSAIADCEMGEWGEDQLVKYLSRKLGIEGDFKKLSEYIEQLLDEYGCESYISFHKYLGVEISKEMT